MTKMKPTQVVKLAQTGIQLCTFFEILISMLL